MGMAVVSGTASVVGDWIAADALLPARHSFLPAAEMALQVLAELGPEANARIRRHPVLVAGQGFGYGTGREAPARALKAAGVRAVIAASFARMFYRNGINNGIVLVECPALAAAGVAEGERIDIDLGASTVRWKAARFAVAPMPALLQEIIAAGDLVEYGRRRLAAAAR